MMANTADKPGCRASGGRSALPRKPGGRAFRRMQTRPWLPLTARAPAHITNRLKPRHPARYLFGSLKFNGRSPALRRNPARASASTSTATPTEFPRGIAIDDPITPLFGRLVVEPGIDVDKIIDGHDQYVAITLDQAFGHGS